MRILHVVTLVTPDGAFGGPVRVAVNHVRELRAMGHEATLVGAASGFNGPLPDHVEDVPAQLFQARRVAPLGFSGLIAPGLRSWVRAQLPNVDYLHIHLARDLITLPVADLARRNHARYAVQTHGMVDPSSHPLAGLLDRLMTRRVLRQATAVFHLTPREYDDLIAVAGPQLNLHELLNGTPAVPYVEPPEQLNVLFLARLHARKRPLVFVEVARRLLDEGLDATFSLVGPDEGELSAVLGAIEASGHADRIVYEGALPPEQTGARLDSASALLLPSVDEPFPMTVLEALAHGRPVLVTDSCGLAPLIARGAAGIVTAADAPSVTRGARDVLFGPVAPAQRGRRAHAHFAAELSMRPLAEHALRLALPTQGLRWSVA